MFFHSQENQKQELSCPVDREELDRQKVTKSLSTRNRWKKIGEKIVCSHFFQNSFQTLKDAFEKVKKEMKFPVSQKAIIVWDTFRGRITMMRDRY